MRTSAHTEARSQRFGKRWRQLVIIDSKLSLSRAAWAALVEELGCQARVQVATTRTDGGGMDTFRALQPSVKMVATVGETLSFAALFAVGLPGAHTPIGFEYQVPVIAGLSDSPELIRAANALGQTLQHCQ